MGIAAHLGAAVHTNFIHICRKQKTAKEKKFIKNSIIDSEEQVLKINARSAERLRRTANLVQDIEITSSRKVLK